MQTINDRLVYSATGLVGFLECGHMASLERAAASGHLDRPMRADPVLDRIAQRGQLHESRFLDSLRSEAVVVVEVDSFDGLPLDERLARGRDATLSAMRDGAHAIYQAVLSPVPLLHSHPFGGFGLTVRVRRTRPSQRSGCPIPSRPSFMVRTRLHASLTLESWGTRTIV